MALRAEVKSLMSGTWAYTLFPITRSTFPRSLTICDARLELKKFRRTDMPSVSAAEAVLTVGSMARQGTPAETKFFN